jgi:hypothetical protein
MTMRPSRAIDFYVGRGPDAEYLGTVFTDYPEIAMSSLDFSQNLPDPGERNTEASYRTYVGLIIQSAIGGAKFNFGSTGHHAADGWPHPYESSADSYSAFVWFNHTVMLFRHGRLHTTVFTNPPSKIEQFPRKAAAR